MFEESEKEAHGRQKVKEAEEDVVV